MSLKEINRKRHGETDFEVENLRIAQKSNFGVKKLSIFIFLNFRFLGVCFWCIRSGTSRL